MLLKNLQDIRATVSRIVIGKEEVLNLLLVGLLSEGHVLIEDIPGVGKTLLARTLAASLACKFRRVQFTPDLMPSDITGFFVYDRKNGDFSFRPGPVMTNILLADEINRTVPRTQSSLLEAMEELQVTVDGQTFPLPRPFLVMATQNPIELEGTFPLPEAQLDRFLLKIKMGYPTAEEEERILLTHGNEDPLSTLQPVAGSKDVLAWQQKCRQVTVQPPVRQYIISLVGATRCHPAIRLGASPRASLALYRAAQAMAALQGRDYVIPDDVKRLATPVLGHRLLLRREDRLRGLTADTVLDEILQTTAVPVDEGNNDGK
ncbi:MAG: MoxR family ATPase [Clostridia bacterium]|nr:MoxR family ATPase [Clostridia bacterium]